ncbi:hypothetical protein CBR_g48820 [Chara braunii]|uniref:Reverse transcriptase domain-containing protein n=1 Tax=Chara braunii TaxID=69332 RepID=A0A388M3S0_CHABU|nr:hypothetical protein CBR_g48820 [Chara braunii]|eukprot:GBG89109.1 hypothetical protein CBR_g48820 [Chara braunii]
MAAPFARSCYNCWLPGHFSRERPHPRRALATGANTTPLFTQPPATTPAAYVPPPPPPPPPPVQAPTQTYNQGVGGYQRTGYWRQTLDRCATFVDNAEDEKAKKKEEAEREKRKKEQQREREEFEARVGERLENRLAKLYGGVIPAGGNASVSTIGETSGQQKENDEVARLRRENEEFRRRLDKGTVSDENLVDRFLRENEELRRKINVTRDPLENGLSVLMNEMQELRAGRDADKDLLIGLKVEISSLRKQKEQLVEETRLWMNEALRPGNKRGCISIATPEVDDRNRFRLRMVGSPTGALREELRKLKDIKQCNLREVEALKQRKMDAEQKRVEAEARKLATEAEVAKLREQVEKLTTEPVVAPTDGTNLKARLDAVAEGLGSWRKAWEIPWALKFVDYFLRLREVTANLVDCEGPLVYLLISLWVKHVYVEATTRSLEVRWKEGGVVESGTRNERLYRWVRRCGAESYVALPLFQCVEADLFDLERFVIKRTCPHLNSRERPRRYRKKRVGKSERRKRTRNGCRDGCRVGDGKNTHMTFKGDNGLLSTNLRTRYTLRCILSGVIRRKLGVNVRERLVVKVTFDETLCKVEVRRLCAELVKGLELSEAWKQMLIRRMRVVFGKNPSVGDMIYNFRQAARQEKLECCCARAEGQFPTVGGHVCFRLSEASFVPEWIKNARNIPRPAHRHSASSLKKQLQFVFDPLLKFCNTTREAFGRGISKQMVEKCFSSTKSDDQEGFDTAGVAEWRERFDGLVRCPIDHNPGDSFVCCPTVYWEGMKKMFLRNAGFEICERKEQELERDNGQKYQELGYEKLGRWNPKGKLGKCYVIPKHKDVRKWRPICPSFEECGVKASKQVARAVNRMLWDLPSRSNFNMRSTEELIDRIAVANIELRKGEGFVSAAFDIKEMFCNLPHDAVIEVVRWVSDFLVLQGSSGVLIQERGKGAKMRMGKGQIG